MTSLVEDRLMVGGQGGERRGELRQAVCAKGAKFNCFHRLQTLAENAGPGGGIRLLRSHLGTTRK